MEKCWVSTIFFLQLSLWSGFLRVPFFHAFCLGRLFIRKMSSLPTGGSYSMTKRAHLDDFPVPSGSWQEAYNAKQKKQNLMLVFGVSMLAGVVTYVRRMKYYRITYEGIIIRFYWLHFWGLVWRSSWEIRVATISLTINHLIDWLDTAALPPLIDWLID